MSKKGLKNFLFDLRKNDTSSKIWVDDKKKITNDDICLKCADCLKIITFGEAKTELIVDFLLKSIEKQIIENKRTYICICGHLLSRTMVMEIKHSICCNICKQLFFGMYEVYHCDKGEEVLEHEYGYNLCKQCAQKHYQNDEKSDEESIKNIYDQKNDDYKMINSDCDGNIDENPIDGGAFYLDTDGDGYGYFESIVNACTIEDGLSENPDDCDDDNAEINPDAEEVCDGLDNDCDYIIDSDATDRSVFYRDIDLDGYGDGILLSDQTENTYDIDVDFSIHAWVYLDSNYENTTMSIFDAEHTRGVLANEHSGFSLCVHVFCAMFVCRPLVGPWLACGAPGACMLHVCACCPHPAVHMGAPHPAVQMGAPRRRCRGGALIFSARACVSMREAPHLRGHFAAFPSVLGHCSFAGLCSFACAPLGLATRSARDICVVPLRGRASLPRLAVRFSRILVLVAARPVALVRGVTLVRPGRPSHVAALGLSGDPSTGRWPA